MIIKYLQINIFLLFFLVFFACNTKNNHKFFTEKGEKFINVKEKGIIGDGKTDNRIAIEKAFNEGGNYYFPKGIYLISSYTYVYNICLISKNKNGLKIKFEDGAIIKAADNIIPKENKGCLLCFVSKEANIPLIEIENLQIDGNKAHQKGMINGILFYEQAKFSIEKIIVNKANIYDTSGGGLHTEATYSELHDIKTSRCGSHGIGINQTFLNGKTHTILIDGHLSIDDDAYSIDFSAPSDEKNDKYAKKEFQLKGIAKNITSINSLYGIKTAGYWDLELENVNILNSKNNGFFLSKDAPAKTIITTNLRIANCKGNGLYLAGKSNFEGKNITIDSCNAPLTIYETTTKLSGLKIKNNFKNIACIAISGEINQKVEIDSFSITQNNKENTYLINNFNDNLKLSNGYIFNNPSPYFLFLGEKAKNCQVNNMTFENNKFYNMITPIGEAKKLNIQKIKGIARKSLIRTIENRATDNLIIRE